MLDVEDWAEIRRGAAVAEATPISQIARVVAVSRNRVKSEAGGVAELRPVCMGPGPLGRFMWRVRSLSATSGHMPREIGFCPLAVTKPAWPWR